MNENPFEAPDSDGHAPTSDLVPIYSSAAVMGTTFVGSALAGSVLVIANAWRLDRSLGTAIAYCVGFNVLFFGAAMVLPDAIPGIAYTMASVFAMKGINEALYPHAIQERTAEGTPWAPWWHGALIAVAVLIPLVLLVVFLVMAEM